MAALALQLNKCDFQQIILSVRAFAKRMPLPRELFV